MNGYSALPVLLRPVIRVVSVASGVDRAAYIDSLVTALFGDLPNSVRRDMAAAIAAAPPLELGDAAAARAALPPERAQALQEQARGLDVAARRHLPRPDETVTNSYASYAACTRPDGAVIGGTVVWVREGSRATVQFELPRLAFDLSQGTVDRVETLAAAAPMRIQAFVRLAVPTGREVFGGVLQLASSVSWALPPPWGAVATGALTLAQMLLGATDEPEGKSPLATVQDNLIDFMKQQRLEDIASDFNDFANNLANLGSSGGGRASLLGTPVKDLDAADIAEIGKVLEWFDGTYGLGLVHNRCTHVVDLLATATLDDVKATIDLAATGITLLLTGRKSYMQLLAARAQYWLNQNNMDQYRIDTRDWIAKYHAIVYSIGIDNPKDGDRWFPRIGGCIDRLTRDRLAKIGAVTRTSKEVWVTVVAPSGAAGGGVASVKEQQPGWSWTDSAEGNDAFAHFFPDTAQQTGSGCHQSTTPVEHRDDAQADLTKHIAAVTAKLDESLGLARKTVAGWQESLRAAAKQMPPAAPSWKPTVAPLAAGPAVPQGIDWVEGTQVSYAIEYKSEKGPSGLGPWSDPMTVGKTAFATVSGLRPAAEDPSALLHLHRKWTPPNGATAALRLVNVAIQPTATSVEDRKQFAR